MARTLSKSRVLTTFKNWRLHSSHKSRTQSYTTSSTGLLRNRLMSSCKSYLRKLMSWSRNSLTSTTSISITIPRRQSILNLHATKRSLTMVSSQKHSFLDPCSQWLMGAGTIWNVKISLKILKKFSKQIWWALRRTTSILFHTSSTRKISCFRSWTRTMICNKS